jgi:hypothetical protein
MPKAPCTAKGFFRHAGKARQLKKPWKNMVFERPAIYDVKHQRNGACEDPGSGH